MDFGFDVGEALSGRSVSRRAIQVAEPASRGGSSTMTAEAVGVLRAPTRPQVEVQAQAVTRFDIHQRVQHILLMSSFIVLALTGLPQKFSGVAVSQWFILSLGGLEVVRTIHKVAAFVMVFDGFYHLAYLGHTLFVRKLLSPLKMIPTFKDVVDFFHAMRYFLGLEKERPKFDRFSYLQKFDYWAVFWGIAIMGGSGFVLMFPDLVSSILPGNVIMLALIAHSDEAVLAVGWIAIVHIFYVHIVPSIFPFNPAIFTGRMPRHLYVEEHPLEYVRIREHIQLQAEETEAVKGPEQVEAGIVMTRTEVGKTAKPAVHSASKDEHVPLPGSGDGHSPESKVSTGETASPDVEQRASGEGERPMGPVSERHGDTETEEE